MVRDYRDGSGHGDTPPMVLGGQPQMLGGLIKAGNQEIIRQHLLGQEFVEPALQNLKDALHCKDPLGRPLRWPLNLYFRLIKLLDPPTVEFRQVVMNFFGVEVEEVRRAVDTVAEVQSQTEWENFRDMAEGAARCLREHPEWAPMSPVRLNDSEVDPESDPMP